MDHIVVLEAQEEGGYTAYVPSLRRCISQDDTREAAIENIREAIELYLEDDHRASSQSTPGSEERR